MQYSKKLEKQRLEKELLCGKGIYDKANNTLYIENIPFIYKTLKNLLKYSGIYKKWQENALNVRIRHESWSFAHLPEEFDGFKILQISDIHIDAMPELAEILPEMIAGIEFDLAVFTGDFRFDIHHNNAKIDYLLKDIFAEANNTKYGAYGIMGNHDYLHYTEENVEKAGLKMLINESLKLRINNSEITIIALDDMHYYQTGRLFDFRDTLKESGFKLLLEHSPEIYREAALYGIDFYLCGHTHGGQVCLPGEIPMISNCRSGRKFNQGRWQYKSLQGYTSNGVGTSGLPIRWNCPPEIVIHKLKVKR